MSEKPLNVAVFASGGGTNFQALLDHDNDCWRIALLVMNRQGGAAARAEQGGVAVRIIPTRDREVDDVAKETQAALDESSIDVVLLAGYLRKIPSTVIDRYKGRMLNVHPALLPDFGGAGMYGMHVHRAVAESDVVVTGATVHVVTEAYDEGNVLGQWRIHLRPNDTPEDIAERVLRVEHQLYPRAVDHLCAAIAEGRSVERMADLWLDEPPDTT